LAGSSFGQDVWTFLNEPDNLDGATNVAALSVAGNYMMHNFALTSGPHGEALITYSAT